MTHASSEKRSSHVDPLELARTLQSVYERALPVFETYWKKLGDEDGGTQAMAFGHFRDLYMDFMGSVSADPEKFWALQNEYWGKWFELAQESTRRFLGEDATLNIIQPLPGDRRFKNEAWQESALFDFIKQSYLLTCRYMDETIRNTQGLEKNKKEKLAFYTRLFADAMSPSNFVMTNPEVLQKTLETGGQNLVKGLQNLMSDLERGRGQFKVSTTNYDAFELGKNLAVTPGKIVYQNDLIQLIQYEPCTEQVFKTPLLIIPPWINKYYILDLKPENSLVKWACEQGHTVFVVSWVNPDIKLAQKRFESYMDEGALQPLEKIAEITGEKQCNIIGYCLGGTLLSITLAWLHSRSEQGRVASATLLTTLTDFENAGEMKIFMDESQLALMDREMSEKGVLAAKNLQRTFSLLRANDLIWSFVVNNYLMGQEPFPFDLLYWNDDATNMPAAMHSFYLRKFYGENLLIKKDIVTMLGTGIDITRIKTPSYFLSTREDHIAPWRATYATTQLFSGPVQFTLAASGHIAGVINHPGKKKYSYWTNDETPASPDEWFKGAAQQEGSWWPHWQTWIEDFTDGKVAARKIESFLENAPGSYVKVKSM
ncbi:MAG: class I poly(R)-hydroxyalkanoic acid synthase [Alphaproteobacteria bacterium]